MHQRSSVVRKNRIPLLLFLFITINEAKNISSAIYFLPENPMDDAQPRELAATLKNRSAGVQVGVKTAEGC